MSKTDESSLWAYESRLVVQPSFRPAQDAFKDALNTGRLSTTPTDATYAGRYMYMGTVNGRDLFKHIDSRQYNV